MSREVVTTQVEFKLLWASGWWSLVKFTDVYVARMLDLGIQGQEDFYNIRDG